MDEDEIARWPRRHEARRQVAEEALRPFVARYGLPPEAGARLSDEIYQLWRHHERHKRHAGGKLFEVRFRRDARALAQRAAWSPDQDELEHAKRMVRLATLERRKVGRGKAIEGAIHTKFADLSTREKREVIIRQFLSRDLLPGSKLRMAAPKVSYLKAVIAVLERETGERLKFSSRPPGARSPKRRDDMGSEAAGLAGRHYGPAFAVVGAAARMAGYELTNEALARLIRRVRSSKPDPQGVR